MTGYFREPIAFRTLLSKCPEILPNSLIVFPDTFLKSVRGHYCPKPHRDGAIKCLNERELFLWTRLSGRCPFWFGRTHPLFIEGVHPTRPSPRKRNQNHGYGVKRGLCIEPSPTHLNLAQIATLSQSPEVRRD
jgi:hypothetical protein